jgi:hypothetical protein
MPYYTRKGRSKKDKGKICVYKKEDNTKVGCTAGPIEKYLAALHIHESDELSWLMGPIQIKFGDVSDKLNQFFKEGEKIYLTGELVLDPEGLRFITLNKTLVNIDVIDKNRLKVSFGKEITDLPIWQSEMGGNYVHLGDVNQDDQIMIILPEKRINESQGLEWISEIGSDTEKIVKELSKLIKQHVPTAELELDWDTTGDGGEYFCRVWLYDNFYDLYKYDKTFAVRFYTMDPETEEYYNYNEYRGLTQTRLLTVLLNELLEVNRQNLNESEEDFNWINNIEPKTSYDDRLYLKNFDSEYVRSPEDIKVGDLLQKYNGHVIYKVEKIEYNDVNGLINTRLGIELDKEVIYRVRNVITNKPSIINLYKKIGVSYPSRKPIYKKQHLYKLILRDLNESEEESGLEWIKDVEADELSLSPNVFFRSDDEMYYTLDQLGYDITDMSLDTMCELAINEGYRWSDKHNGWYHRDEAEDFSYLGESTVDDLEWMKGPARIRFGDIKHEINDYVSVGDKIYLSGFLYLSETNNTVENAIILDNEHGVIDSFISSKNHPKVNVSFGENITNLPLWVDNMSGDYVDLGAFESDDDILITLPQKNNINESEDLNWIENVPSNEIVKPWDGTIGSRTTPIYNRVYLYTDDDGVTREVKVGGLTSNYWTRNRKGEWFGSDGDIRFYDASISDEEIKAFNSDLEYPNPFEGKYGITMSRREYNDNASNGKIILTPNKVGINESEEDEFDWVRGVEIDLVPGEIYDIKTGNGYYWVPEKYVGKGWDEEHQMEFYKFEDIDGSTGSGRKSVPYVKDLMKKGHIRLYDPNWSIKDELTFSDNIEDALKGNFVIYFKDGVYLDQTLPIQDKLFKMGFSFYTKEPNEYITNKDSSDKIQFFESFNWDTSNPRYNKMPSDQWDKKKILLSSVKKDDGFRWRPKPNPRLDEQELFLTIMDHNAIVINGDKYVTNNINESDEFDWIQKQEPEKVFKKSKRYVIDVSHLRPAPMRYSHDPSLTKQDILRKLDDLGYDVHHIDVDEAKYFYIEPTDGGPSWQYDEYDTPIQFDYWVDYNTDLMDDPSYGGKYQMIDVDEFMFLIDNNLIGESEKNDFDWVRDIMDEPITVCDAANVLGVGDIIMINELPDWQDSGMVAGRVHKNITAEVLAIAPCNEIQSVNVSKSNTILIHVNDNYIGFDESWVREFKPEYIDRCLDGRCMFLVCGDEEFNSTMITPINDKIRESKKPINESAGISFEARKWADIIYDEITSNSEEENRLIIDGYDYPEAFNGFPIDYVVIDFYDRLTGYGQEHSGYDKDGNYVVLLYVQPQLVRGQGGYSLKSALNHEMKHAWEDYNRLSKGLPSIEQTKESQELYNRDFILMLSDQNIRGPIKEILKYYYYLSNLEKSAYLENVYDQNPAYENMVREIASKDFESFKGRYDLDINWHLMNTAYNIPFLKKFKSPIDFIDYSAQELRSRALKMIKKMNKMKYIHGKF